MQRHSIPDILAALSQNQPIILFDDETRENEADLVVPAAHITAEQVNFVLQHARGLLCVALEADQCQRLALSPAVQLSAASASLKTAFTLSVDAARGITTGISAQDRALTIQSLAQTVSQPEDFVQPGHVFPIRARPGGVLARAGHTEASTDLMRLAGCSASAAIIEMLDESGRSANQAYVEAFAQQHHLKTATVAQLIQYRIFHDLEIKKTQTSTYSIAGATLHCSHFVATAAGYIQHYRLYAYGALNKASSIPVHLLPEYQCQDTVFLNACTQLIAAGQGVLCVFDQAHAIPNLLWDQYLALQTQLEGESYKQYQLALLVRLLSQLGAQQAHWMMPEQRQRFGMLSEHIDRFKPLITGVIHEHS